MDFLNKRQKFFLKQKIKNYNNIRVGKFIINKNFNKFLR